MLDPTGGAEAGYRHPRGPAQQPGRSSYKRDLGLYLARLAVAHAADGDLEQARVIGQQALAVVRDTHSARTLRELNRLATLLRRWNGVPGATELTRALHALARPTDDPQDDEAGQPIERGTAVELMTTATARDEQARRERGPAVAVLPVGAFEQHGDFLPLITDTAIACVIAGGSAPDLQPLPATAGDALLLARARGAPRRRR